MYEQMTLWDTPSVTSLPALADGALHYVLQTGPMTVKSGLAHAHASLTALQDAGLQMPTPATSGPNSDDLSPSAVLQASLESRLRERLGEAGSPEYAVTWKHWDMPQGGQICALRASARHTSDSGCIGWPTLIKRDGVTLLRARRAPNATGSEPMAWVAGLVTGTVKENRPGLKMDRPVGLNPAWACWLMGFPDEWTKLAPTVTPSSRKSRSK